MLCVIVIWIQFHKWLGLDCGLWVKLDDDTHHSLKHVLKTPKRRKREKRREKKIFEINKVKTEVGESKGIMTILIYATF